MKILFLDQSGSLGGAELCLLDIVQPYRDRALVGLFTNGPFRHLLEQHQIPVQVMSDRAIQVRKQSHWWQGLGSLGQLLPIVAKVVHLSYGYDLIYANTQKALVVGALASVLTRRPLIYHLHDILSTDHFSSSNLRLAVTLANQFATQIIATSEAARDAFIAAGGEPSRTTVVYNGFDPALYECPTQADSLRSQLGWQDRFIVGHFSRLSPWKGQHILLEALAHCPENVTGVFVGDALYGEQNYVQELHQQVKALGLQQRVKFLGFRSDVVALMHSCDAIAHTSTAPEPLGRVVVEAMLCGRPVIAAQAGGMTELVEPDRTGWLVRPGDAIALANTITHCQTHYERAIAMAQVAKEQVSHRFHINTIHQQIAQVFHQISTHSAIELPLQQSSLELGG
jgi:glycosyltransferase involved in cell wall biosynthesis